jgi:general transcription factor IIIA
MDDSLSQTSEESGRESDANLDTPITAPQTPLSSGRKTLHCPYEGCIKSFNRQARLTEHIRSHTNERPFQCPEDDCDKAFLRDSHLKHHIKSAHTNERDYPCTWANCDKKFATGTRLRRHEACHKTKEKYTCKGYEDCNESFRKHATLSRHILAVHEKKKPFPCTEIDEKTGQQCSSGFDTAEKLRSHQRSVHDQSRFVCMDCLPLGDEMETQVSFATYAQLQNHIAEVHPPTCPQCSLLCESEKDLRRHLELVHNMVDPEADKSKTPSFPCTYPNCDRSFTKKGNLNVHVKTVHEHRKDFVCGETELMLPLPEPQKQDPGQSKPSVIMGCGRHFTSKATLEEHVRTAHLGMNSKRQERNKKRLAENAADADDEYAESGGRAKKKRKTKVEKSAIAELTGSANPAAATEFEPGPAVRNPFDAHPYAVAYNHDPLQGFDSYAYPQQEYGKFFMEKKTEDEFFTEASLGPGLNNLAASALVDPVLLAS